MKIISWNCNGKFREKFRDILELDADIYVIKNAKTPQKVLVLSMWILQKITFGLANTKAKGWVCLREKV